MAKQTFSAKTFAANTFASGTFRGVGVAPKPAVGGSERPPYREEPFRRRPRKDKKKPVPVPPEPEPGVSHEPFAVPLHVLAQLDEAFLTGGLDALLEAESRLLTETTSR